VNKNASVAAIKNGIHSISADTDTVKLVNNEGIQTTANALKVLDPKIFQSAIECFHAFAALTEIINSGREVQIATASIVIIDDGIFNNSPRVETDLIV